MSSSTTLPPSSPRLPSPPPPAEIQLGPKSPGLGNSTASRQSQEMEQTVADANARRRIHPGTKAEDMAAGPPLVPLAELDSPFQLQEHLAALHYHLTASNTQPVSRQTANEMATPPPCIDRTLWLYELCRFLVSQCNSLIVGFLFDSPPCSQATCPEMRASEWQFLCAVHDTPKSCCAIDYCCHTLDWAANIVTNPKIFPSRFVLVQSDGHEKNQVVKNLINVFRRLHRIFAHAWFQHRSVFWSVEAQTGLYVFFKTVCDLYDLLPAENYKLPPEAEGLELPQPDKDDARSKVTAIAKPASKDGEGDAHDDDQPLHARRSNTARHSSRPSTGNAITTVVEEREDENSEINNRMRNMQLATQPETVVEEESEVEVPVMVEEDILKESSPKPSEDSEPQSRVELAETTGDAETTVADEKAASPPVFDRSQTVVQEADDAGLATEESSMESAVDSPPESTEKLDEEREDKDVKEPSSPTVTEIEVGQAESPKDENPEPNKVESKEEPKEITEPTSPPSSDGT